MHPIILRRRMQKHPAGRLALRAMSVLYGAGVLGKNLLYQLRILPSKRLKARTICIGNLTTGGTGKTSAVLLAAQTLHHHQVRTAILSRGYRRVKKTKEVRVLTDSNELPWQETGDEPWMMHRSLKGLGIPILISPDRYGAGKMAMDLYGAQVLLMDDGFSHRKLRRDLDVVLVNALDPFGGGKLLPYGNLREPLRALERANLIVITHADQVSKERLDEIQETIQNVHPKARVAEAAHRADFLFDIKGEVKHRVSYLKGKRAACFSGIGEPRPFEQELRQIGADLIQVWRYPDHHPYSLHELRSIENARGGIPVVTTFKDVPRLPPDWQSILSGEVFALGVKLEITKGKSLWESFLYDEIRS